MAVTDGDAHLIDAVIAGEQAAWRDVIARYEGRLTAFARRRLADKDAAEDIVQETFLGLLRSLPRYDRQRPLETYLFAILRNKLTDHFRKSDAGQRQSLDALDVNDSPSDWLDPDTPSRHVARSEDLETQRSAFVAALRGWVDDCLQNKRFRDLVVVEMLVVLGMRNKEVAEDLDMTERAVAGVKFRVIDQWRQAAASVTHAWGDADLAQNSTAGRIWREEGVSCLKRSTLGRYLLGALDEDFAEYIAFHVDVLGCERCAANLEDLRREDEQDAADEQDALRQRLFASSVGFLSRRPE